MRKYLAIVGSQELTRSNAPFDDPNYDIWVFNEAAQSEWCTRWDVCFQMHRPEVYTSKYNLSNSKHWEWLQQSHNKTIFMIDRDERVPDSKRYPLEEIQSKIPQLARDYEELSAVYALLYAILECQYKEIHIYGMDLVSNTEYIYQADCWRSWVMWAWGRGEKVIMHCNYGLFGSHRYGYDGEISFTTDYYQERVTRLEKNWKSADQHLIDMRQAVENAITMDAKDEDIVKYITDYKAVAQRCGELAGMLAEAQRYLDAGERPIYRNDFERRAAQCNADGEKFNNQLLMTLGKMDYVMTVWSAYRRAKDAPKQILEQAKYQLKLFVNESVKLAYDVGAHYGGFQENMDYIKELDKRIQAAGGRKTVQVVSMMAEEQLKEKELA